MLLFLAFLVGVSLTLSLFIKNGCKPLPRKVLRIIFVGVWRTWHRSTFRIAFDALVLLIITLAVTFGR